MEGLRTTPDAVRRLSKYCFYLSIAVFLYAILFPFRFDFSWQHLLTSWTQAGKVPFWNAGTGINITLDDVANILLTLPLGFFGSFLGSGIKRVSTVINWFVLGLAIGFAAEFAQLAILTRSSGATDVVTNGLGTALGVVIAYIIGQKGMRFFTGTAIERRNIYLWLLIWSIVAMLGPFNLGQDFPSHPGAVLLQTNPSAPETLTEKEWIRVACFALIGALAAKLAVPGRRKRTLMQPLASVALVLLLPVIIHFLRILVEAHPPYLDDLVLDIFGALSGAFLSLLIPSHLRALSGFLLFKIALLAAALNPYNFSTWNRRISIQWIPFYELCKDRTPLSFYEATLSLFTFAILGGLLQLTFPRMKRWHVALYGLIFSAAIEYARTFLPAQSAGTAEVIMACLGAWIGAYICTSVESARSNTQLVANKGF